MLREGERQSELRFHNHILLRIPKKFLSLLLLTLTNISSEMKNEIRKEKI